MGESRQEAGSEIRFGPIGDVSPALAAAFEAQSGKPVTQMTDDEKRAAAAGFLVQHFKENDGC